VALSPGMPTSFVPKQPVQTTGRRPMRSGSNIFLIASCIFTGIMLFIAAGVFAYDKYLASTLDKKEIQLAQAQASVNEDTIEEFVRLRDRLSSGKELLNNHVVLSQFFDSLESLTLQNVSFGGMSFIVAGDRTAKLEMDGTARNFNALAAQSNAFAAEKRIKRAIFSGITLNESNQVGFTLTADIDSRLVIEGANGAPIQPIQTEAAPVATTTAPVTTGTTTTP
jgi:hypothetical protein